MLTFSNTYQDLGDAFYQRIHPAAASNPTLLLWNSALAERLAIAPPLTEDTDLQARLFSGNQLVDGSDPIALAYCGHQFGQLNPQLGDGRAHLLGEVLDRHQRRFDIQLKGSGRTPFSRGGDGRCALGPALREYIMSEAMFFLGVPTSRCLAVVATGDPVYREEEKPGAVVTRVAASHIRVGTFVYFAIREDLQSLQALLDHSVARHYPEINRQTDGNKALLFLLAVIEQQILLVIEWMRVGFIHGVMNTDNMAISGETIDYGPCAMMGAYDPATVYSSIDTQGRYAFGNQPNIVRWNMTRLAESLLTLIHPEQKKAVELAESILKLFPEKFEQAYFSMLGKKLGMADTDSELATELLQTMHRDKLDYTETFLQLTQSLDNPDAAEHLSEKLGDWYKRWRDGSSPDQELMKQNNPVVIPRNHHIEQVLASCEASGNADAAKAILAVLRSPYSAIAGTAHYQDLPVDADAGYQTFCGT